MSNVVQKAVLQIGRNLRPGLSADEVRRVVADGVQGLNGTEVQQVVDKFHREMARIGDEYFHSVIGVTKQTLSTALNALARGPGGNGALTFLNAQRQLTIDNVSRFLISPRPGEGRARSEERRVGKGMRSRC